MKHCFSQLLYSFFKKPVIKLITFNFDIKEMILYFYSYVSFVMKHH